MSCQTLRRIQNPLVTDKSPSERKLEFGTNYVLEVTGVMCRMRLFGMRTGHSWAGTVGLYWHGPKFFRIIPSLVFPTRIQSIALQTDLSGTPTFLPSCDPTGALSSISYFPPSLLRFKCQIVVGLYTESIMHVRDYFKFGAVLVNLVSPQLRYSSCQLQILVFVIGTSTNVVNFAWTRSFIAVTCPTIAAAATFLATTSKAVIPCPCCLHLGLRVHIHLRLSARTE